MTEPATPRRPIVQHYADRFTVDLDAKGGNLEMRAIQAWHHLGNVADAVDVHVSSSGRGLHFVAYLEESLSFAKKVEHRRAAGDDARRIDMEIQRWHAGLDVDVLFSQKDGEGGTLTKERRFSDVYDALDHIKAQQPDQVRMDRLAEHGHKGDPELARKAWRAEA